MKLFQPDYLTYKELNRLSCILHLPAIFFLGRHDLLMKISLALYEPGILLIRCLVLYLASCIYQLSFDTGIMQKAAGGVRN